MQFRGHLLLIICGVAASFSTACAADSPPSPPAPIIAAAATISDTLKAAGPNAAALAGPTTAAAIRSLGGTATKRQIAALVYAAVRATPASALNIVRYAVAAAPDAAPDIAAAAARAVPNPWKEVRYQKSDVPSLEPQAQLLVQPAPGPGAPQLITHRHPIGHEPDFKSIGTEPDFKSPVDSKSVAPEAVSDALPGVDPANPGNAMSLAEAIVQTAINAGASDPGAIQSAVDAALFGDPGQLFNKVGSAKGISGVGDAGNSNYANEPHDPGDPGTLRRRGLKGPRTPDPSPVSR